MIRIAAVVVGKMGGAWRDAEYVLLVVRSPLDKPRWVILSGIAWPEVDKGSESNQLITSLPVGSIELSDDWSVFRFPEKQHQPDFWIIGAHFMSTFTNHAGDLVHY